MKKLGVTLMTLAFAVPLTFAASKKPASPATQQAQTTKAKTHKTKAAKKSHHKKSAQAKPSK